MNDVEVIKMAEFRQKLLHDEPRSSIDDGCTLNDAWVDLADGPISDASYEKTFLIEFKDWTKRDYRNFDKAYDFVDRTQAARWCIPAGYVFRLYFRPNFGSGGRYDLVGRGFYDSQDFPPFSRNVFSSGRFMRRLANGTVVQMSTASSLGCGNSDTTCSAAASCVSTGTCCWDYCSTCGNCPSGGLGVRENP